MKQLRRYDDTKEEEQPKKKARGLPKDLVDVQLEMPALPKGALVLVRMSPLDLLDGEPRSTMVWNPSRCEPAHCEEVKRILTGSMRGIEISAADEAALQFFSGGPKKVAEWEDLASEFKQTTRYKLGFVYIGSSPVRVLMVDEEDYSDEEGSDSDEESNNEESSQGDLADPRQTTLDAFF